MSYFVLLTSCYAVTGFVGSVFVDWKFWTELCLIAEFIFAWCIYFFKGVLLFSFFLFFFHAIMLLNENKERDQGVGLVE